MQQIFKLTGLKTELWVKPGEANAPGDHEQFPTERRGASEQREVRRLCPQKGTWRGRDTVPGKGSFGIPIQGGESSSQSFPAEPCVRLTGFHPLPGPVH